MAEARRTPNPRPLALVLAVVAFLGGSCQLSSVMNGEAQLPERADMERALEQMAPPGMKVTPQMSEAAESAAAQVIAVHHRFESFEKGFALLLLFFYAFAAVFAMRAARYEPGSGQLLALFCLGVPPARVAVAAVDFAIDERVAQAYRGVLSTLPPGPVPASTIGDVMAVLMSGFHLGLAILVCLLFTYGWRYFSRPQVQELYEVAE